MSGERALHSISIMPDFLSLSFKANSYAWPVFFIAAFIPLAGFYIFNQNRKSSPNRTFFFLCLAIFFWMIGQAGVFCATKETQAISIYRTVAFLGVSWIGTLVYYFSVVWLGIEAKSRLQVRLGWAGSILFYVMGLFSSWSFPGVREYYWGYYPIYGPVNWAFLTFFFFYFFAAFFNFLNALKTETNRQRIAQIQLINLAFIISFFSSLDYLPKLISFSLYPLGFLYVFVWIMIVAYAIIKYHAMDIETVIHKTAMWAATLAVALIPFIAFVYLTHGYMKDLDRVSATAFFSLFAILFYFYFRRVKPLLDKLFQKRRSDLSGEFQRFSRDMIFLTDLRSLLQRFARLLRRSLYARDLSIYVLDEPHNQYVPVIAKRVRHLKPFQKDQAFLLWLSKEARVSGLEKLKQNPENEKMVQEINTFFESLKAMVLMPLMVGEKLIGFVSLGKRMNLQKYKHDDIQFLTQLAVPVSIALSNTMQYEKVHQMSEELQAWNRELESRVEARTRELRETQEQLIQAEKMATLGILAGGVAHEINNPLTAVLTNAQILKMSVNEDDKESLDMIEEGAKRCQIIVQKLLNYSRSATVEAPNQKTDLNRAIKNTVAMLVYQLNQDNIEVEFHSDDLPPILAVQNEIEQVFTNLIVNARDAIAKTARGRGKICIRTFTHGRMACAEVKDDGCGMAKETMNKMFDPFFTTKDVGEGTGLGLSVTHGIIKHHNGEVFVQSELGKGTTVTVSFPIA